MSGTVCIGNTHQEIYFGGDTVLLSLDASPLSYGGEFPARDVWERDPLPRILKLEGCITSEADTAEERREEIDRVRRILSGIVSMSSTFYVRVGDKTANLTNGGLRIVREAPFTGETAERFILEAQIACGYFLGKRQRVSVNEGDGGFFFPLSAPIIMGERDGTSYIRVNNRGDVPAGFTAELSPSTTVTSFRLENTATGEYVSIPQSFGSGDVIRLGTLRDDLYLTLIRGGKEYNLTGVCEAGSTLFLLPVGESVITVGEGQPFEGVLTFSERYVSF